jgi:hypothetical protein
VWPIKSVAATMADEAENTAPTEAVAEEKPKKKNYPPRNDKPIEELFDLTQPIPRVRLLGAHNDSGITCFSLCTLFSL